MVQCGWPRVRAVNRALSESVQELPDAQRQAAATFRQGRAGSVKRGERPAALGSSVHVLRCGQAVAKPRTGTVGLTAGAGLAGCLAESTGGAGVPFLRQQSRAAGTSLSPALACRTDFVFTSALGLVAHLRACGCPPRRCVGVAVYTVVVLQSGQYNWLAGTLPVPVHLTGREESRLMRRSVQSTSPSGHGTEPGPFPGISVWAGHTTVNQLRLMHLWLYVAAVLVLPQRGHA